MRAAAREPPAEPAPERSPHCMFCRNHGIIKRKNGHVCEHKDCDCLLCQLTTKAQVAMRHQQALWRHQGREMANNKNFLMLGVSSRQASSSDEEDDDEGMGATKQDDQSHKNNDRDGDDDLEHLRQGVNNLN